MADMKFEDLQLDQDILFEIDVSGNGDWRFVKGVVKENNDRFRSSTKSFHRYNRDGTISQYGMYIFPHRMDEVRLITQK